MTLFPELVNGFHAGLIRRRIHIFIFLQALLSFRNPLTAWKELIALRKLRGKVHGAAYVKKYVKAGGRWFWNTDYCGFPSDQLKQMIRLEFQRRRAASGAFPGSSVHLQTLIWGITNRCPLACTHCYEWDNLDEKDHLSLEELLKILAVFRESGLRHIQFSGGEPLARFNDLLCLVRKASETMDCWLLTSGFGLTREKADALADAGLTGAQISLDHWDEGSHNVFRNNEKSFGWVKEAVKNCREAGLIVSLSLCATRDFVNDENLMKYAVTAREMGAGFIRILEPRAAGRFSRMDVKLRDAQVEKLSAFTLMMNNDRLYRDFPVVAFFGYHQRILGCFGAGNRYLYVDPRGDIHACPFCRGKRGNILEEPFSVITGRVRKTGCLFFNFLFRFPDPGAIQDP